MKFDQLLTFLNDLTKSEFFTNSLYVKYTKGELDASIRNTPEMHKEFNDIINLKRGIQEFKISNSILKIMESEYNEIKANMTTLLQK